ncbi:bifunctional 2-polyprenyl-6-hydroxyphenol methylase/3-demethylubiquinol 3-O-methyltransferase UbiG [Thaumasiovibrio sp. DFM-14]|uniref:bifunctional 2-polyprenyl-6-hydroxyphenol methylase/3-demethylubiquinol 3-O-methyltransferase UbiG n=1 Tax=Thaumasiovibrio sp. DFM-14 TaxID=3384792 RepID=UPI0039A3C79D
MAATNVDLNEIAKFEQLAAQWWDLEGKSKPLHQINPLRLNYVDQRSGGLFAKTVLDVGCGGGILSESMAQLGAKVTGIDMGKAPLNVAKLHALESQVQVNYLQSTAEEHADNYPEQYDIVTCMELLEHVPDPASVIHACCQLVKPGGHVFFSTLNRNIKSYLFAIIGAEHLMQVVPKGTHDHGKFIRPSELLAYIDTTSLTEQHITGLQYNPLFDSYKLGRCVDINYIVHTTKAI